MVGMMFGVDWV